MTTRTLFARQALLEGGWHNNVRISLAAGKILGVEGNAARAPSDETCDTLLPGMANLHSHAFQRIMAGRTEVAGPGADTFWSWRDLMYRTALALSPDDVEAIAAEAYIEMLEAGFTRVGEFHYLHHATDGRAYDNIAEMATRIAAACAATGIRLTLLPVRYATSGFGGQPPAESQRRFITSRDAYEKLHAAARAAIACLDCAILGVAPHSLRAVTEQDLAATITLAGDGPRHIHIAEQTKEVDDCLAWSGQRPVQWLMAHTEVDHRWCLIHATHSDANEIEQIAKSKAIVGLCPLTEANLGDGIFPARALLDHGGRFGIGTDQNAEIGLAGELNILEYGQRLSRRARNVLTQPRQSTGSALFEAALKGGTQATGADHSHLSVGSAADMVTLKPVSEAWPMPLAEAALDAWIFSKTLRVDAVYVGGKQVVADGHHVARAAIERRYGQVLHRLMATA